jgi:hypothetical protein
MKKKFFTALLSFITVWSGISAQESVKAFDHLAVGVELFSTTGFGLELATPLSSNFALRGGVSLFPAYSYNDAFKVNLNPSFKSEVDDFINSYPGLSSLLEQQRLPTSAEGINTTIDATSTLNFFNGKILVDYYPTKYAFHITGGVYIGKSNLIDIKGKMDQAEKILSVLKPFHDYYNEALIVNEEKGYQLTGNDLVGMKGALTANSVKPYLGIGFGRAVPKSRVGVNFEIGAFYQGTPKFVSANGNVQNLIDAELTGVTEVIKNFPVYPVISLKLNIRIF